jgi:signal transduction histidine kinase
MQSDRQQFRMLQINEELEEYKQKLENRIQTDKLLFQKSREAQMGEMISMIAHQWRQPLAAINSTIIGMQLNQLNPKFDLNNRDELEKFFELQNQKFERINKQVKQLSYTIDDFRDFFKPNKEKKLINITIPIIKVLDMVQINLENKGINIITDFQTTEQISIHENEILQVILNIIQNCEDNFIIKNIINPFICIKTIYNDNNFIISICDNGGGISNDILLKIFDPYFSTKEEKNGTGIGLYMSKMIIEEHNNGKLVVENKEDGVCFNIIW